MNSLIRFTILLVRLWFISVFTLLACVLEPIPNYNVRDYILILPTTLVRPNLFNAGHIFHARYA